MALNNSTKTGFSARLLKPVHDFFIQYGWLIVFYTLVPFISEFRGNAFGVHKILWQSVPLYFLVACAICIVGLTIRKIVGRLWGDVFAKLWHSICHVVVYSISFIDFYLRVAFHTAISQESVFLLLQTNSQEIGEFLQTYIFKSEFIFCVMLYIIFAVVECITLAHKKWRSIFKYKLTFTLFAVYLALAANAYRYVWRIVSVKTGTDAENVVQNNMNFNLSGNLYIRLYYIGRTVGENMRDGERLDKHIDDTRVYTQTRYEGNIVLVIGESHIKRHSSLYGYSKVTNPKLTAMKDSLSTFTDVISSHNQTHTIIRHLLSVMSVDDDRPWYESSLFPAVFKAAGWNVTFCSNQITDKPANDRHNAAIDAFLNTPKTSNACFATRNKSRFIFDGEMIDSFIEHKRKFLEKIKPSLYIIQLKGQHVKYDERYPSKEAFFKVSDYADRKDLSKSQKQDVAAYDNACRYNDKQLHKLLSAFAGEDAVVIYMSDHGEEVHDYRNHMGRSFDLQENAPHSYHCQIDVPFFVYMTDTYQRNHPLKAEQIKTSVNRPFMTDDICHLLFYLGDVDTQWYDSTRCLIHPDYNTKRKRVLHSGEDYDEYTSAVKH